MGAALFLSAGTLQWPHGLAFLASYCGYVLVRFMLVWREHREWERSLKRQKV